jgi:hypothetical protein
MDGTDAVLLAAWETAEQIQAREEEREEAGQYGRRRDERILRMTQTRRCGWWRRRTEERTCGRTLRNRDRRKQRARTGIESRLFSDDGRGKLLLWCPYALPLRTPL